ncbi:hypothetical protein NCS13_1_0756 [Neochlamydia sp. S13]|nr:hypothetical protein NCS13_1_0756 [Neochlamydia sp. S13]
MKLFLSELTSSNQADDLIASHMISELSKSVQTAYGDGAYDSQAFYFILGYRSFNTSKKRRKVKKN